MICISACYIKRGTVLRKKYFSFLKVHLPDKKRIQGYQEENPEEFGSIDIHPGIQASVSGNMKTGTIELPKGIQREKTMYILMTTDRSFKKWDRTVVQPRATRDRLFVEVPLHTNAMYVSKSLVQHYAKIIYA